MFCRAIATVLLAAGILAYAVVAQAVVTIPTVWVTNPGNANDSTGYGGVDYVYRMGKYEVTNSQYCEFLNNRAVTDTYALYNTSMSSDARGGINRSGSSGSYSYAVKSGYDNMPVTFVCWYDCVRFANWLQNGQGISPGTGDTEGGTYKITGGGPNSGTVEVPDAATRATWTAANPHWVLPSENEWYKSAYHQPSGQGGDADGYWAYPTATNTEPHSDNPASLAFPTNSANFYRDDSVANGYDDGYAVTGSTGYVSTQNYLTNVGAYTQSDSFYGTFDQGGNVWEWNEALIGSSRGLRGGVWSNYSYSLLSSYRYYINPAFESSLIGFRVASVPEPGSITMLLGIALTMLLYCWRKHV
jgi:formylglycine-generating enzyme required for sulfatase activity